MKSSKSAAFKITKERRDVWKIELRMLEEFKRVCKKHHLKYFAFGGTMLGAIRHKGYIPWDDDIDLAMLRSDYDKLREIADSEFKEPYFFQTDYNDRLFRGHAQLRNSDTTGVMISDINRNYNQGIFIDIFPLDEYPADDKLRKSQQRQLFIIGGTLRNYYRDTNKASEKIRRLLAGIIVWTHGGPSKYFAKYEKIARKYNGCGNGIVGALSVNYGKEVDYMKEKGLHKFKEVPFEDTTISMPLTYDEILTQHFGDYMKPSRAPNTHGDVYFSSKIPYKEFIKKVKSKEINANDYTL